MNAQHKDYATGKPVNLSKPEEKIRQEYERVLVEDYGYAKSNLDIEVTIQIGSRRYFCDIAVYDGDNIVGIVETKAPHSKEGKKQLDSYMTVTGTCQWGVWTNGDEEICAVKEKNGKVRFDSALSVPRCGGGYPQINSYEDLIPASNLKRTFKMINNSLYANTNLARTEKQGAEMVRLIFCKLVDEYRARKGKKSPAFQVYWSEINNGVNQLRKRVDDLWETVQQGWLGNSIFAESERIEIDDYSLQLIVSKLQSYSLLKTTKDIVGDAFEVFSEKQFAGEKGQFFTPRTVVSMVVEMIAPKVTDQIIDPACGSGGFLIDALAYITSDVDDEDEKRKIAEHSLFGIDKESDLAKICKAHMCIIGDGKSNIVNQDSLKPCDEWIGDASAKFVPKGKLKEFDICLTNPPFGATIKVERKHVLEKFVLGYKWAMGEQGWQRTTDTTPTPPQLLFLELCLRLLKPGGKLGIVLPDGLLGNKRDGYVRHYIRTHAEILAVVDCPTETFMPHTGTKTSVLIMQKKQSATAPDTKKPIFFAIAEHCGHTMRGDDTGKEDFSAVARNYNAKKRAGHLGFYAKATDVLVPRYYDPRIVKEIKQLEKQGNMQMMSLAEMQANGDVQIVGVPASAKSQDYTPHGTIRFIRTSDIAGYELCGRVQKMVDRNTYLLYQEQQDLQLGDILFVKDGDTRIGETAILVDKNDLGILVQTHFKKIRAVNMDPYLLLWLLNRTIVKKQIRQRVFNQSTLSTIGERIDELRLPLPNSVRERNAVAAKMKKLVTERRQMLRKLQSEAQ